MKIAERIYRGLLLLYPPSFRREYRELMQQALRDQMRDSGGGFDRLRLWTRTAVDLLASASVLRLEDLMSNRSMLMGIGPYLFCLTAAVFLGHFTPEPMGAVGMWYQDFSQAWKWGSSSCSPSSSGAGTRRALGSRPCLD